jgi:hypothetical protein
MTFTASGPTAVQRITAPASPVGEVRSRFVDGLTFQNDYPTTETVQRLYDELDFPRACQVFLRNLPAASMYDFRAGLARDLGVDSPRSFAIWEGRMDANSLLLTANTETLYGTTFLDLKTDGPIVVEAPPGVLGLLDDMWMRPIEDIGPGGPDGGRGGAYLVVPPGYSGDLPADGYYVVRPRTYGVWLIIRAFVAPGGDIGAPVATLKQTRVYPLAARSAPPPMSFVNAMGKPVDTISPADRRYFAHLAALVEAEHEDAIDPESAGMLATIGIQKGTPFAPDARLQGILDEAARVASAMALVLSDAPRGLNPPYPDRQWSPHAPGYPTFTDGHRTMLDGLVQMAWFGTGTAKAMGHPKPGTGSVYSWTYREAKGEWLSGDRAYRLHLPAPIPAANFWSVIVYDVWTRSMLANGQDHPRRNSFDPEVKPNDDGSVDLFFGPEPPAEGEGNWIRTVPGKGWFVILRLYGPLEPWFDSSWKPGDVEAVA